MLKAVPVLNAKSLTQAADVVNEVSGPFGKAFFWLQGVGALTPLALVAAVGILGVTKALNAVPKLNPAFLILTATVLNQVSGPFGKALFKLGLLGVFAPTALVAAASILGITIILNKITPLKAPILMVAAATLAVVSGPFAKGLLKLGLAGFFAPLAMVASVGILAITKILNKITPLKAGVLIGAANVISKMAGPLAKGLFKLGLVSVLTGPAVIAAYGLLSITKSLSKVSPVSPLKLMTAAQSISMSSGIFSKGLLKLGLLSMLTGSAVKAASGIMMVTKLLKSVPFLNPATLLTTASVLSKIAWPFTTSLGSLAPAALVIVPALAAAVGILGVTQILKSVPSLSPAVLLTTASVLSKISWPFTKSLGALAPAALAILPALGVAKGILEVTKSLSAVPMLDSAKLLNASSVLLKISKPFFVSLGALAFAILQVAPAIGVAAGINQISKYLATVSTIKEKALILLSDTLGSISGNFFWSLGELGASVIFIVPALAVARGINQITKYFAATTPIDSKKLVNISSTLMVTTPALRKGIVLLGAMGVVIVPAVLATMGLVKITNTLKNIQPLDGKKMSNVATILSSTSGMLAKSLAKLGLVGFFAIPAVLSARGLATLSKIINQILPISNKSLLSIGNVLNATSSGVLKGVIKLSVTNLFLIPSILAAKQLLILSRIINQIPLVTSKGISSVGNVTSSVSGQVFKGLIKLSSINLAILPAIIAAKSLVKLSRILSSVQQIQVKNLSSISTSLSSTSIPILKSLLKFATITFAIAPAILTAYGLRKLSRILLGIAIVDSKPIMGLSETLSASGKNMLTAITLWSVITPFIVPAIIAAAGVSRIFRSLAAVSRLDLKGLAISAPILGGLTPTLLKFSSIGLVAPLLFSASLALATLGRSLQKASIGFVTFASIPWTIIGTALPTLNGLLSTLINFGFKGLLAAPGILAMAATFGVLGRSLTGLSSNFALSTQSMSNYSKESERLRTVANAPKPVITDQTNRLKQSAIAQPTVNRTETGVNKTGAANLGGGNSGGGVQVVQIKPIQIDLKLNGRQLQQIIVEANYNRT